MTVIRKVAGKTKIDRIRSQKTRESWGNQSINKRMERRKWGIYENATRMDAERLVKISRDNIPGGIRSPGHPEEDGAT